MTTITTGTSGPQAWKMILAGAAVGLATIAIVNLPQTSTDTTGQQATEGSQAVTAENPQTRSFFDENPATGRTSAQPDSVTGFEYGNESTTGQAASPGVTTQYSGNSGELFPYENGTPPAQAPTGFSGPTPDAVGAQRVDPRAAAAAGLSPGAIDAVVGGTTQVASTPDNLADAQARASVSTQPQVQAFAASDEALVNPVAEVNTAQMIQDIIDSERSAPAVSLAGSDDALVNPGPEVNTAPYVAYAEGMSAAEASGTAAWNAYVEAVNNGTVAGLYSSTEADPFIDGRVDGDPYLGGTSDESLVITTTEVNPADVKFLGTPTQPAGTERTPQQNVSIR